jgi:hypothetical protein
MYIHISYKIQYSHINHTINAYKVNVHSSIAIFFPEKNLHPRQDTNYEILTGQETPSRIRVCSVMKKAIVLFEETAMGL